MKYNKSGFVEQNFRIQEIVTANWEMIQGKHVKLTAHQP